jgi:hypothetical protein
MPRKLRKSFVELPNAILFLRISRERVFQHPRLFSSTTQIALPPRLFFPVDFCLPPTMMSFDLEEPT